jgi:hypothetical protein
MLHLSCLAALSDRQYPCNRVMTQLSSEAGWGPLFAPTSVTAIELLLFAGRQFPPDPSIERKVLGWLA